MRARCSAPNGCEAMSSRSPCRLNGMIAMTTDEPTFAAAVERHRRELHVHCYRMLGSFEEAEDALQDALMRAWRGRGSFTGAGRRAGVCKNASHAFPP